jgi:hypothetical protein
MDSSSLYESGLFLLSDDDEDWDDDVFEDDFDDDDEVFEDDWDDEDEEEDWEDSDDHWSLSL